MKRVHMLVLGCLLLVALLSSATIEGKKAAGSKVTVAGVEFTFTAIEEFRDLHIISLSVRNQTDSVVYIDYRNFDAVNSMDEQINVLIPTPMGEQFDPIQALRPNAKVFTVILFDPACEFKLSSEKPLLLYYMKNVLFKVYE